MTDFPRWKYALVAIVLALGLLYALPNVFRPQPAVQISANRGATIDSALQQKVTTTLAQARIPYQDVAITGDRMLVRFANTDVQLRGSDTLRLALGDQYTVALNLATTVPAWLQSIGARAMPLGLDLQGGVHFLMQVDQSAVVQKQQQRYLDDIRSVLREKNVHYESVTPSGQGVQAVLRSTADRDAAAAAISADSQDLILTDTTTPSGGVALQVNIKPEVLRTLAENTIRQNVTTLRNRINVLGVSEPVIQQQGDSRIVVELPGVQDTAAAKKILGATATLEYHANDPNVNPIEADRTGIVPPDDRLYHTKEGRPIVLKKKVIVSGDELVDASQGYDQQTGLPDVNVELNSAGARKMLDFTTQNVGKPMAVVYVERVPETKIVNGKEVHSSKTTEEVINNATIQGVFGKRFQTTGLGQEEAQTLAVLLRSGSLAAPVDIVEQRVIGHSLGQDNITKGEHAVMLGLVLVLLAAAFYYKLFGVVADIALFFNLVILIAVMSAIGVTLTMPGIAGIVLTLGMAIDANVLICERVREELRNGSTPLASIRAGYEKAWATILDANVTHLLAALGLMTLGSGAIKGFGITLFIGILTSLFTSVTVTHAITAAIHGGRKLKTLSV